MNLDAIDLAFQADANGIELACSNAEPGQKVSLECVEIDFRLLHCSEQAAFDFAVQSCVCVQHAQRFVRSSDARLIGED